MNKAYRLIWNKAKELWVVAAETVKGNGGPPPVCLAAIAAATFLGLAATGAHALPSGGQVAAGQAAISTPSASQMNINQGTNQAIINWNSFGIGRGEAVKITQPTSQSTLLNRVLGNNPSNIFGSLNSNGRVFLVNPSGVLFAPGSSVNVGGLVASSLNIKDSDFLAGKYSFFRDGTAGSVVNQGNISGGFVTLLGSSVENAGTIITTKGTTSLAAGDEITLGFDPNGLMAIKVDKGTYNAQVANSGVIEADGGTVVMTAKAADALLATVVNNSGIIRARGMVERNGEIVIEGNQIINSGTISASGGAQGGNITLTTSGMVMNTGTIQATGDTGGQIAITAQAVVEQGTVDASGETQGGSVLLSASDSIEQTANSVVRADAAHGSAGTVRAESLGGAYLSGTLSASGSKGGEVAVTAPNLVLAGAALHADGTDGGGRVRVGGGWQGKDADLANTATTTVNHSDITANATGNGVGGTVVVWSEQNTLMAGAIEARGGATGGNGGKVEISSHGTLALGGSVDVTAPAGISGSVLLDPKDINIVESVASGSYSTISLTYSTPKANDQHGSGGIVELMNGTSGTDRVVVASPSDNTAAATAGAVRLYKISDGTLLATLTGSQANDQIGNGGLVPLGVAPSGVRALTNGNYVVISPNWDNGGNTANAKGAVTWGSGTSGISGVVSSGNSLVGSTAGDQVGYNGVMALTTNGNYLVRSTNWDNGGNTANAKGAVTWGSSTSGISGIVSSANSLVGSTAGDRVGAGGVTVLTNGNYVVNSWFFFSSAGAVTWGSGTSGISGAVSSANSLVGSHPGDNVGINLAGALTAPGIIAFGVTALTNGNYVVSSPAWSNGIGAVTWGSGTSGISGEISSSNSLVGSTAGRTAGDWVGLGGVTALTNGNYVVSSSNWDNGGNTANAKGAVTWGSGTSGIAGIVSSANSLVGSTAGDQVGYGGVTALLTNGNYVVRSYNWDNGGSTANAKGAATWGSGTSGIAGIVSSANSLVGSTAGDQVGSGGVTALTNGNYVVRSSNWDNGAIVDAGAATWGSGTSGIAGIVSSANSLVGSTAGDQVGYGGVTALLTNGNYVVNSYYWDNGGSTANAKGAVTWGSGTSGISGAVSSSNSLVGSQAKDQVGNIVNGIGGVTALTNGNYFVNSFYWDNGGTPANAKGAVTWGSGTSGISGAVSSTNSLVGSHAGDQAGSGGVTALTTNGNYVVLSSYWDNGGSTANAKGAVTWGSGTSGISGAVSSANSLVGSTAGDRVGSSRATALTNGNYVVRSPLWDNGTASDAGAVTWGSGTTGISGAVTSNNSLVGTVTSDGMGTTAPVALSNGNVVVPCPTCDVGGLVNSGRVDILIGRGSGGGAATTLTNPHTFATDPTGTSTLLASAIKVLLDAGTAVTLQANNTITLSTALTASNASGNGGALIMQAGRSILLNANITTDNGNLTLVGNETTAAGVVNAYRDSGAAVITMGTGTSINAGTGAVDIQLKDGAGKTNTTSGAITLHGITAGNLNIANQGTTSGSGIILNGAASLTGNLTMSLATGSLTQSAALSVAGTTDITAGTNDITLTNATNNFTGSLSVVSGKDVSLRDTDALIMGASTISGNLTVQTGGALTQSGALAVTGTTGITAGAVNNITLDTATNNFTGAVSVVSGKDVSLRDTNALVLGASTISGNLTVQTGGALTQSGALVVTGTSGIAAGTNDITLDTTTNKFTGAVSVVSGKNVSLKNSTTGLTYIGTSNVSGNLTIEAASEAEIYLTGNITKDSGDDATLTIKTPGSIVMQSGKVISSTIGKLNTVFWADTNANGGYITMSSGSSIDTNGGHLWLGGGSGSTAWNGLTVGNGYATYLAAEDSYGGIALSNATLLTKGGALMLKGKSETNATIGTNIYGASTINSGIGEISINGVSSTAGVQGLVLLGSSVTSTTGDITLITDRLTIDDTARLRSTGTLTIKPYTDTTSIGLSDAGNVGTLALKNSYFSTNFTNGFSGITFGSSIAGAITVSGATTFNDSTTLSTNSTIALNGALTANENLTLTSNGAISQGSDGVVGVTGTTSITAGAANNITLAHTSNDFGGAVSVVSGKNISILDSNAMTLGAVTSTLGTVDIATLTGNLTLTGAVTTTNTSASAITLNAGKSTAAGTATGGNITINDGSVSVAEGGTAKLFSGNSGGSTGLAALVSSDNLRYNSDKVTSFSPALGSGRYAIYRGPSSTPVYLRLLTGSSIYGDTPSLTYALYNASSDGSVVSDASPGGSVTWSTPLSATSNANTYGETYVSGLTLGNAGYTLSPGGSINWIINPRPVTLSGGRTYDGTTAIAGTLLTLSNRVGSDSVTVGGTGTLASKNFGSQNIADLTGLTIDNSNYTITGGSGSVSIAKAPLIITAATNTKVYDGGVTAAAIPTVSGIQGGTDTVTRLVEVYANKNAAAGKTLNVSAYIVNDGNSGNNYTVTTVADTTGIVTKATLTTTGATAQNKTYDATTTATITGETLAGILLTDAVTVSGSGTFADVNVGTVKAVTAALVLAGTDAANYNLTQPGGLSADITSTPTPTPTVNPDVIPPSTPTPPPTTATSSAPVQPPPLPNSGRTGGTGGTSTGGTGTTGTTGGTGAGVTSTGVTGTGGTGTTGSEDGSSSASAPGGRSVSGGFTDVKSLIISQPISASFIYPIPENTFSHSNPKAVIALEARMADGSPLPAWMSFDPAHKVITGTPPKGVAGEFHIRITARDQFGGEAQTVLKMNVGM